MKKKIAVFAGNECVAEKEKYYYSLAYQTGRLLAENNFVVVTGGGPGLMNEVLRGAYEAGGETIGVRLNVPGRKHSQFATKFLSFDNLNKRQEALLKMADGFISLPGGVGTLYEIFAVLALKRKGEMAREKQLVIVDGYYKEFQSLMEKILKEGFAEKIVGAFYKIVENPEMAIKELKK